MTLTPNRRRVLGLVRKGEIASYWHNHHCCFDDPDCRTVTGVIKALVKLGYVRISHPYAHPHITDAGRVALTGE